MDEVLLHTKLDKLLVGVAKCESRLEAFDARLEDHTEQDNVNFSALRSQLSVVEVEVEEVSTKVEVMMVKHDLVEEIGRKSGRATAAKVAPIMTALMVGAWEAAKAFFGGGS
jgi:hypothetical protein